MSRIVLGLLIGLLFATSANAATCFWVGGTGTWNNSTDTAFWKSSSGGGVACAATGGVPKNAGDIATFDAASGGGTVTVNANISIAQITMGAFTGTLDFSANNNSVTLTTSFIGAGAGTRTLNLGNGVWTFTNTGTVWDMSTTTGLTFNANSSNLTFTVTSAVNRTFNSGGLTYSTITISANSSGGAFNFVSAFTMATLSITAPTAIRFPNSATVTITNAFTLTGTSSVQNFLSSSTGGTTATIAAAASSSMSWAGVRDMTFTGAPTATNSFDLGHNSGITITPPSTSGGIIGGWLLNRDLYHDNDNDNDNDNSLAWLEKIA